MQITAQAFVPVPMGEYVAKVVDIEQQTGNFGPQLRWRFEILQPGGYAGKLLIGWTSTSASLKGRFMRWAGGCLGHPIAPGEVVKISDLIVREVVIVVTVQEGADGEYNKVENVRPHRRRTPPPTSVSADADGDDLFGEE